VEQEIKIGFCFG